MIVHFVPLGRSFSDKCFAKFFFFLFFLFLYNCIIFVLIQMISSMLPLRQKSQTALGFLYIKLLHVFFFFLCKYSPNYLMNTRNTRICISVCFLLTQSKSGFPKQFHVFCSQLYSKP